MIPRFLGVIAALAFGALTASAAGHGRAISTLADYVHVAGEVGAGRLECNLAFNLSELRKLGQPFQGEGDEAAVAAVSELVAKSTQIALALVRDESLEVACPRLLNAYGPQGTIAPGLLNSPGSE